VHLRRAWAVLATAAAIIGACGGSLSQVGKTVSCPDGPHLVLDCSSEVSYQGIDTRGNISALGTFQASGRFQDVAIRRVNDSVARYISAQTRLCRDYNGCALDRAAYQAEAKKTRDLLLSAAEIAEKLKTEQTSPEQMHTLDQLYTHVVPDDQRVEELTFQMALDARLPESAGSGALNVAPGQPIPTNSRLAFSFKTSRDAHLYIFQINAAHQPTVLFPDARIGTSNPIPAGTVTHVPAQGQFFRLNDQDVGSENVYIVASRQAIASMDSLVAKVTSGQVSQVSQDSLLANLATVRPAGDGECQGTNTRGLELEGPPAAGTGCTKTRGLTLETADGASTDKPSITARTAPGDSTIVKVFPFTHVTEAAYAQARQQYQSPDGARQRGLVGSD
jgi:Domain of unknown function (DUF4384)